MIYFTSDLHFSHKNILDYSRRPFSSVEEMNEELIKRWNQRVGPDDEGYILGDFSFARREQTINFIYRMNGRKYLIKGNHDKRLRSSVLEHFEWHEYYHELSYNKTKIVLCHFPFLTWNKSHRGSINLHGHCHGKIPVEKGIRRMDVGVDTNDYYPYSIDEVFRILKVE